MIDLPFDRVQVDDGEGGRVLSPGEFLAVPLPQRTRWILERRLDFFAGTEPVDRRRALQVMRAQKIG